jgi:hypothetical protein
MHTVHRVLGYGWTFTQTSGDQETEDGEWLETSTFPTSVHVELLHLKKITDPVSQTKCICQRGGILLISDSSLGSMSGTYSVRASAPAF